MTFDFGPFARIILRYGAGFLFGQAAGDFLAGNEDIVLAVSLLLMALAEYLYGRAKVTGGKL